MANLSATSEKLNKPDICRFLKARNVSDFFEGKPVIEAKHASVLVPLFLKDEQLYVLLTVRCRHMRIHGGEVAFPGGKKDKEDKDHVETALREAEEEIGLLRDRVEVITQIAPFFSKTGLVVTPVVGFIDKNFVPQLNPDEVEHTFSVPLVDFLSSENHSSHPYTAKKHPYIMHFFFHPCLQNTSYRKTKTYGLTAHIALAVACIVYKRPPDFEVESGFDWEDPNKGCEARYFRYLEYYNYYNKQSKI